MTYRYVTGNIDGKWYSSSLGREYSSSMSESLTDLDSKELEKYFTDTAVTMKVKGSNAKVTASYTFDKKTYIKDYRERFRSPSQPLEIYLKPFMEIPLKTITVRKTIEKELDEALEKLRKTVVKSMIRRQAKQRQPFSKGRLAVWDIR